MEEFNFFRDKRFIETFKREKPHLVYIEKIIQQIKFGRLTLVLRVHDSEVTDITTINALRFRFDRGKDKKRPQVQVEPISVSEAEKEVISIVGGVGGEGIS